MKHLTWGERVVAVVSGDPVADEAIAAAVQELPPAYRPKQIEFVAELPLLPNGKVDPTRARALFSE